VAKYYRNKFLYRDWIFQEGDEVYVLNYPASSEYAAVICGITSTELLVLSEKGKYYRLVIMDIRQGRVVLTTLSSEQATSKAHRSFAGVNLLVLSSCVFVFAYPSTIATKTQLAVPLSRPDGLQSSSSSLPATLLILRPTSFRRSNLLSRSLLCPLVREVFGSRRPLALLILLLLGVHLRNFKTHTTRRAVDELFARELLLQASIQRPKVLKRDIQASQLRGLTH